MIPRTISVYFCPDEERFIHRHRLPLWLLHPFMFGVLVYTIYIVLFSRIPTQSAPVSWIRLNMFTIPTTLPDVPFFLAAPPPPHHPELFGCPPPPSQHFNNLLSRNAFCTTIWCNYPNQRVMTTKASLSKTLCSENEIKSPYLIFYRRLFRDRVDRVETKYYLLIWDNGL